MPIRWPIALILLATLTACADQGQPPAPVGPMVLTIEYRGTSDERPLEALKLHSARDNHPSAPNLLTENLERNESVTYRDIEPGRYYLTVVRLLNPPPDDTKIAITIAEPFTLSSGHVVIWVFDESFRVFDAVNSVDGGGPDLSVDFGSDLEMDAGPDIAPDATDDGPTDGASDAIHDAGSDGEAGVEAGADAPRADGPGADLSN